MEAEAPLRELRREIARMTMEIVRLMGERNDLAKRVGRLKSGISMPIEDERIEDSLVKGVVEACAKSGVDERAGLKVLSVLLAESKRAQGLEAEKAVESPMSAFTKAVQLQREGKKLIRMDLGEPDFRPPRPVLEACSEALFSFRTHYTITRGIPELTSELRNHLLKKQGYGATEGEVMVTPGGRFAVYSAVASVVGEGESAIVVDPSWPAYKQALQYSGGRAIAIPTSLDDDWDVSAERVKESVRPSTRAIIVSYPSNPTGKIISKRTFKELVGVANDAHLTVISDEIYNEYAYRPCPSILEGGADSFVLTASFSKTWAMTGFRIGYAVSSADKIDRMLSIASLMITSVPEFIQHGAIKALQCESEARRNSKTMKERIGVVGEELDKIGRLSYYSPDGAMYFFPQLKGKDLTASAFADRLLERGVSVTPGTAFGDYPMNFRISLTQPNDVLVEGIREIGRALA